MDYIRLILQIVVQLITLTPLVIELVKYVRLSIKEKNWGKLLNIVLGLIQQAETTFDNGATRKEWVMAMAKSAAASINYEIDEEQLSELIDSLVELSKKVNVPKVEG